ncbi:MAG TPA: pyrroline-5-carboxylate reductase [Pseudolabrys sp.]|nr:pyrroline-5-carboxylate reductase [Pseudolabrys sp.]
MARRKQPSHSLRKFKGTLVLVGAGKMGGAMLDGWLARGLNPKRVVVLEPQPAKPVKVLARRGLCLNQEGKIADAAAIVIAVKPQSAPEALPPIATYVGKNTLVLSIMAGRTIAFLEKALSSDAAIVRAMPNTPAAIGRGITVAVGNRKVAPRQRKLAGDLLAATGKVEWVTDEQLMDAVTAVSGSGPAYVFLLAECMAKAGIAAGLPAALATTLARETVAGSGELLHRSSLDAATLRQNVTSPGGTTAAALEVLMGPGGFDALLTRAIAAATRRSRELAG